MMLFPFLSVLLVGASNLVHSAGFGLRLRPVFCDVVLSAGCEFSLAFE
jgi:hypothetical protein